MQYPRKLLIQMSGAPGSGKSTVATLLAQSIDGVVINHDLIKAFFLKHDFSFEQSTKFAYSFDWVLAEDQITQGKSVIVDSTCNYSEVLEKGTALAEKYGYSYWYVECRVDDIDLLDRRLRCRVPLRSQRVSVDGPPPGADSECHDQDHRALFKKWIEHPCRPASNAVLVNSAGTAEECRDSILEEIALETGAPTSTRRTSRSGLGPN